MSLQFFADVNTARVDYFLKIFWFANKKKRRNDFLYFEIFGYCFANYLG